MSGNAAVERVYQPWESDHTALVHVLWGCKNDDLTLAADCTEVASRILQSEWFRAVKQHVREGWR